VTVELQTEGLIPEEELDIDDDTEVEDGYAASEFVGTEPRSVVVAIALLGDELPASLIAPT
jgi:hypothetical protein